jgi:actin-related protein
LISFLNIGEKGADNVVLELGSHSIKLGLASQMQPFMVPTVIAYPTRVTDEESKEAYKFLFDASESNYHETSIQERFDKWSPPVLKQVIGDLRSR